VQFRSVQLSVCRLPQSIRNDDREVLGFKANPAQIEQRVQIGKEQQAIGYKIGLVTTIGVDVGRFESF
jgi:hypothetical protein